jgi:undecaprenyl diphosphate synthase
VSATAHLPAHIAIIMDGNGRWAEARRLPRLLGHRAGAEAVRRVVEACRELGIPYLTLYAFSWENWARPAAEITDLMRLLEEFIEKEIPRLQEHGIRVRTIGRLGELPASTQARVRRLVEATAGGSRMTLTLALSYGGRQEIVDAARRLAEEAQAGRLSPERIDEALVAGALYTVGMPDPDLVIRTSGEQRLSNFLLWQSSYAELYVCPKAWPDFTREDLTRAIAEFQRRERRFGGRAAPV